ncbi:hypothetical protein LPJ64_002998 [Coemansia asiatica]|uniref:Pre-mRNA-splicing factor 18 n=1 Tax=Coemansia asiatica TaxID=1052880 RepID=A0A9W7XLY8_9FUNG|nr:hypothetical protein LPJ64_002998 [Coemansia asiatica]
MDLLKAAIGSEVKKRKAQYEKAACTSESKRRKKYVRVADLEKAASDHDDKEKDKPKETNTIKDKARDSIKSNIRDKQALTAASLPEDDNESAALAASTDSIHDTHGSAIGAEEIVKRLRARGEPIRLFGESDDARRKRLRHLELSEEKTDGQQNEFRKVLAQVEAGAMLEELKRQANMCGDSEERRQRKYALLADFDVSAISTDLLRTDIDRLHTLLYVYFKRLVYEWADFLDSRPDDERRSAEGKMAAATQRQAADYLRPLFRNLKGRKLPADVLARITEIARNMLDREYMCANDAYLQLSIGNAPWPLGVTQVGIHARAARENINAEKVAHVLNDETQRKWIQSIKRLIRFAQTKYPPADLAKMVG